MDPSALPRVSLARLPTPVLPLRRLLAGQGEAPTLYVKRDDLTGTALSGNKVRKLELLFGEALEQGADTVLTCGGAQSNHCRATALAATQLGLRTVLLLRTPDPARPPPLQGNLLLDRLCGAEVRFITPAQYAKDRDALLQEAAAALRAAGSRPYVIPEGGSNALGSLGYALAVRELAEQLGADAGRPLTLCHAAGSGGTSAGLVLGVALCELPWRVVGFHVCDDRATFVQLIGDILGQIAARFGIPEAAALSDQRDQLDLREAVGRGYALSRPEELALIRDVCRAEGLILDPVYTGKAMFGLLAALRRDPRALGERVLFFHTGGLFGLFDEAKVAELAPLL